LILPKTSAAFCGVCFRGKGVSHLTTNDLIIQHYGLAVKLSKWFHPRVRGLVEFEDLQGVAILALVETANSPSCPKDEGFEKYVAQPILMAMRIYAARQSGRAISGKKWKDVKTLKALLLEEETSDERTLSDEELCERLGWTMGRLFSTRQALEALRRPESLDRPMTADEREVTTVGDFIPFDEPPMIDTMIENMEKEELRAWAQEAVNELPKVARIGISLHFGIKVPAVVNVDVMDVLGVAVHTDSSAGVRMLRKELSNDEKGLAKPSAGTTFANSKSLYVYGGTEGESLALKKWERLTSDKKGLPWYEPAGSVGNL
jgi:DNA-directed RNA polymerase specialized sigma subunit